jgi:hypothetical protein
MVEVKEKNRSSKDQFSLLRKNTIHKATSVFIGDLDQKKYPDESSLDQAKFKAENTLRDELLNDVAIDLVTQAITEKEGSQINISKDMLKALIHSWFLENNFNIPSPTKCSLPINWRIALSASVGTVLGAYLLSLLLSLILTKEDAFKFGILAGGAIGAFLIVLFSFYISRNRKIKNGLLVTLGFVTVADIIVLFRSSGGLGGLWRKIRGKQNKKGLASFLKRLMAYILILFILILPKRKISYDLNSYEDIVRNSINLYFDKAFIAIQLLVYQNQSKKISKENDYVELIDFLFTMKDVPVDELPDVKKELLSIENKIGIEGLDPNREVLKNFSWSEDLEERYKKFGLIENDDEVFVEKEAIVVNGEVLKKGLVRKRKK